MRGTHERPAGLTYQPELVNLDEERSLLAALVALDFREVRMHGQIARRTVGISASTTTTARSS